MPGMDEFEVALRVHKFRSHSWPFIIALRPTASSEEHLWSLPTGGNERSSKVCDLSDEFPRLLQRGGGSSFPYTHTHTHTPYTRNKKDATDLKRDFFKPCKLILAPHR